MPEYTLYYFPLFGRADPIRAMLEMAGTDWVDNQVPMDKWPAMKASMPNGQMPCLELADGTKMGESTAIARYVAQKHGFYPSDPMAAFHVDEMICAWSDIIAKLYSPFFAQGDDKAAKIKELFETQLPGFLKVIDAQCAKGEMMVGQDLTAADFFIGGIWTNYVGNPDVGFEKAQWEAAAAKFPNFKAYGERYAAKVDKWISKRGARPI